jgi:serine/threonine-protein kinase HipA
MTSTQEQTLDVVLYGQPIGALHRPHPRSVPSFNYRPAYVETGGTPLSVRMPLRIAPYEGKHVAPFLQGLLPENPATRTEWAERLGADNNAFSLLARMGWDCPGAVQFTHPDNLDQLKARDNELVPLTDTDIGERLRALRHDDASWTMPEEHWSLPGQQGKFALARRDGRWYEARGSAATTHIFKPGIERMKSQALIEHLTMRAAAFVGIDTAATEFLYFDGEPAIVATRFDRIDTPDGVLRIHQEDFCQALGKLPEHKYEADGGPDARAIAQMLQGTSSILSVDRQAFAAFLIINYVAGAPDGHSKNISLALPPGQAYIAPLYDLATGFPYDRGNSAIRQVAMSIGGRRKLGEVMPKNWDKAAATLGLPAEYVRWRAGDIARLFPDALATAMNEVDDPAIAEIRDRTMSRVEKHCNQLIKQLADAGPPEK